MRVCKLYGRDTKDKDVKFILTRNMCRCKTCVKRVDAESYAKSIAFKPEFLDAKGFKVGRKYSTKGMTPDQKMNMFMHMVLVCEDAGYKK